MGKPDVSRIVMPEAVTPAAVDPPHPCLDGIRRGFSIRCVTVLLLTIGVLISTVFWILPITRFRPGFVPDNLAASAEIQASFILQRPFSLLTSHTKRLEYDIYKEIGIPNTKVSIISMHPTSSINCTFISFGVLPEPRHAASISLPAISLLRSSLIELVLQKINLTLTPSIFGETFFFEVLKFPGGITIIPLQTAFIWERTKTLFNFTVGNSVAHIQENMKVLKDQLKFGLNLRPYENIYVQMTNVDGSTVAPPVTLQASILSGYGTVALLPNRLKQLADAVIGFREQNLGLNHSVFGEVKSVVLSSYLNNLISSSETPTPSPSPSPSPSPDHRIDSYSSNSAAPNPSFYQAHKSRGPTPQSVHKVFYDSSLLVQDKESIEASTSNISDSVWSSSTSGIKAHLQTGAWLLLTAATSAWILLSCSP